MAVTGIAGWFGVNRLLIFSGLAIASCVWAESPELAQAKKFYNFTDYDRALQVLLAIPNPDAAALELTGRVYFMQGEYKKATETLENARAAAPDDSGIALWLGRAWGRRAETASPFTAPGYAGKARQSFERAVALDPHNLEALNDVFEYYLEAPGFLGGGFDKAVATSEKITALDPVEGHWAKAKLAEKRKQFSSAEEQLRRAAELAPHQVGHILDLARFFAKQGRYQESDQSFQHADQVAPNSPKVMYAKAEVYLKAGRNVDTAKKLLKQYLASSLTPDDPPRSQAEKLLRQAEGS